MFPEKNTLNQSECPTEHIISTVFIGKVVSRKIRLLILKVRLNFRAISITIIIVTLRRHTGNFPSRICFLLSIFCICIYVLPPCNFHFLLLRHQLLFVIFICTYNNKVSGSEFPVSSSFYMVYTANIHM